MILINLFLTFFKIGAFTFGGGYAMLPIIQEQVAQKGWLTKEQLINFIAVSESTPGPFAINVSTYVGMETAGILGAVCATLGVVMPSFIIILIVARFFIRFKNSRLVSGAMSGLKPAVIGLISSAVVNTASTVFFASGISFAVVSSFAFISSAVIFLVMLLLVFKKCHPILIVLLSALMGIAAGYLPNLINK